MELLGFKFSGTLALMLTVGLGIIVVVGIFLYRKFRQGSLHLGRNMAAVQDAPAYATLKAPDRFEMHGRIVEMTAKRKVLLAAKDRLADYFKVYEPPRIFMEYSLSSWALVDELFKALLDLNEKSQSWVEERNGMVGELRELHAEVLELRKLQQPQITRLKEAGKKKR